LAVNSGHGERIASVLIFPGFFAGGMNGYSLGEDGEKKERYIKAVERVLKEGDVNDQKNDNRLKRQFTLR
jgi:hypothetical protein